MRSKEIKQAVAETICENKMALFVPVFILTLLGTLSEVFAILALVCFIILPPLSYGVTSVFIRKRNGEDVQPFDLFNDGFSNFGRAWKVSLRLFLKYLVPVVILAFALIAPLVVEISTTMAAPSIDMSLMPSYSGATVMNTMVSSIVSMIALVAYVISFIILIPLAYKYRYAYNEAIMAPDTSTKEVMVNTAEVMNGNKWKSFCLDFSYIPRAIGVCILSVIIGIVFTFVSEFISGLVMSAVIAYLYSINVNMAHVIFYEDKRTQKFGTATVANEVVDNNSAISG